MTNDERPNVANASENRLTFDKTVIWLLVSTPAAVAVANMVAKLEPKRDDQRSSGAIGGERLHAPIIAGVRIISTVLPSDLRFPGVASRSLFQFSKLSAELRLRGGDAYQFFR